jgi:hypothetical protein
MVHSPIFLSPALPSELLTYIVSDCLHPTTLVICSSKDAFLAAMAAETSRTQQHKETDADPAEQPESEILAASSSTQKLPEQIARTPRLSRSLRRLIAPSPLYQIAIARHLRIIFVPTVSHLRAVLAIFDPADSKVAPPLYSHPAGLSSGRPLRRRRQPLLLVYGFIELHHDTSEWSAQGLGTTTAILVEAAARHGFRAAIVEARRRDSERRPGIKDFGPLEQILPIMHASARRLAGNSGWSGRTIEVRRVLGRWFRFAQDKVTTERSRGP